ncbi:autotransporter outer membrane beta-barrel domain-containing protein [Sutterella sp.]|uniref:autotransporter outer membrane beta-barrel domain-containing protein n=1 Tax=Sutterella sp. TaxID=1981025 RepID=UPI0026DFF22F|nr:autotransporter outer membrane beta-barrel domain-containing protein [Sutterella sp.]MDO5532297.1 autotransporter outer membrane beta-barrel domain-containing protein [Sutterella sp.]
MLKKSLLAAALALALPSLSNASWTVPVTGADGSVWAYVKVLEAGEPSSFVDADLPAQFGIRTLRDMDVTAITDSVLYLSSVLGPAALTPEIELTALALPSSNAAAESGVYDASGISTLQACILGVGDCQGTAAKVNIDLPIAGLSHTVTTVSPLPTNGEATDLTAVVYHELIHALGIGSTVRSESWNSGAWKVYFETDATKRTAFTTHLVDLFGTKSTDSSRIEAIFDVSQSSVESMTREDGVFYILFQELNGGVKFSGDNVTEVIGEGTRIYFSDTQVIGSDGNLVTGTLVNSVVGGLPVNGYENTPKMLESGDRTPDLHHIELQNGLMSHQMYRNWGTLMEAELAVLQDLGYTIDRKRFFGTSIYSSGGTVEITQAFTARENGAWTSSPSTQSTAIGVHVYGSLNTVTVAADQLADGDESIGVRVDGQKNAVSVASGTRITANGTNGAGIAFTYGFGHTLTLEAGSTVSAAGSGGRALVFDFGSNALGDVFGYRGSYTQAYRVDPWDSDNPVKENWVNAGRSERVSALNGALVESVTIAGAVSAPQGYAIYISPNALVGTITIASGAVIEGDIVSKWNAKSTVETDSDGQYLQAASSLYDGIYAQADVGTDLTTNLVFGDGDDFSFTYYGNITGADGMRITFADGVTTLHGTASVLGAVVNADAALKGATTWNLTVADESGAEARVYDDSGFIQGALVNAGAVWSTALTGTQTINGDYRQTGDGTLVVGVSSSGKLASVTLTGTASVNESEASAVRVSLVPDLGYWADGTALTVAEGEAALVDADGSALAADMTWEDAADLLSSISGTLTVTVAEDGTATISRTAGAYSGLLGTSASAGARAVAAMLDRNYSNATTGNAQLLIAALDFSSADVGAAAIASLTGDAHISAVRAQFAMERLIDRTLARAPSENARTGRHVWAQPFGGRLADNTAGSDSRTKAAGIAGGVTVTDADREIGWQMAAAYFSESNSYLAKTRGQGLWLGASLSNEIAGPWWLELSGRVGMVNVKTERAQPYFNSSQEVKGTRWSAALGVKAGPRLPLADGLLTVRPGLGLIGTVLRTPSKTEENFGGLAIEDAWYRSLRTQIGVAAETAPIASAVTGFSWKWTANAAWERELLRDAGEFTAGIAGLPGTFSQRADWNDRSRWILGGGLELAGDGGFSAAFRLEGELTHGDGAAVTGGAELSWRF